jgi:hypothetical protein
MSEAQDRILTMLEQGKITAEVADQLLATIGPDNDLDLAAVDTIRSEDEPGASVASAPDYSHFRRMWRIPFLIAAGSLLFSGLGLAFIYQAGERVATLGFFCVWSIFLLAFLATLLLLLARRAPWLHLRVEEQQGPRFAISLPLPLGLAGWILGVARRFVPKSQVAHLDTAEAFMAAMRDDPGREPIVIDVDDDDGGRVQIFIG